MSENNNTQELSFEERINANFGGANNTTESLRIIAAGLSA